MTETVNSAKEENQKPEKNLRVEQHVILPSHPYFSLFEEFTHKAKNLYNHANFLVRQEFINNGMWLRYQDLDKLLKADAEYPDYREMKNAQSAQQTLRRLDNNWKSFFKAIKDWKEHKEKYTGRPKLPKYKKKDGLFEYVITNQNAVLKGKIIQFPKCFNKITFKPRFVDNEDFKSFQQVRIIPRNNTFIVELVYEIKVKDELPDNHRYLGVDLGIDNLVAVATSEGQAFLVNGKGLKARNKHYNKLVGYYKGILKMTENRDSSPRLKRIHAKRNRIVNDFMHKTSRYIVDFALKNKINTIIIGNNKGWKQEVNLGAITNQTFVQIPYKRLINMIQYKAKNVGIRVVVVNEAYTSGTSFLDDEKPTKRYYNKSRRTYRGLFVSNSGQRINADINASLQIIKKFVKSGISAKEVLTKNISLFNPLVVRI